jgi:hypothetical protein
VKQITILCSNDLVPEVQQALVRAGVEGFLHIPGGVGVMPGAAAPRGDWPRWEADMVVAPVPDDLVSKVLEPLRRYAGSCEVAPCLRVLVSALEEVL